MANDVSREPSVVIRLQRWRPLSMAVIFIPASIFGCYRGLTEQNAADQVALALALPIGSVLVVAHYFWFYYVAVGDKSIVHLQYFFMRRTVPLAELSQVTVSVFQGVMFNSPHVRFLWPDGEITLIVDVYDKRAIKRAVVKLQSAGVPVDPALLNANWLPN